MIRHSPNNKTSKEQSGTARILPMTKVLIVEDDAVLTTLLQAQLERLDYKVMDIASSGEQAIEITGHSQPDLILMDIMMPGKYNGIQAAEIIVGKHNTPIIFLTARSDEEAIAEAKKVKPYGYLIKPVKIFDIKAAIEMALARKDLEQRLNQSEAKYRAVIEDQTELVCRYTPDRNLTFANMAFCRHFDLDQEKVASYPFAQATPDSELPDDPENPVITRERCLELSDGRKYWYQWTDRAIFNEKNEIVEYQSVGTDITILKQTEEELTQHRNHLQEMVDEQTRDLRIAKEKAEEANRAKSEFLANMSHELRTPLHGILSFSQLGITKLGTIPEEKTLSYFSKIEKSGNRLLSLLNNLLDLSQMEAGITSYQMGNSDLLFITNLVVAGYQNQLQSRNQTVHVVQPQISTKLVCDSFRIEQLINNLVSNAARFSPNDKEIFIEFENGTMRMDDCVVESLSLQIRDQGVGIPENELVSVFEKFSQSSRTNTGAGGSGLGLAICSEIVKAHRGTIVAENHPEGGAVVRFTLPADQSISESA